jgi:cell division protease FtsH
VLSVLLKHRRGGQGQAPGLDNGNKPWRVEGGGGAGQGREGRNRRTSLGRRFWWIVLILLAINWWVAAQISGPDKPPLKVPYSEFTDQVRAGNVAEVTSSGAEIHGVFRRAVPNIADGNGSHAKEFETIRPRFAKDDLLVLLDQKDVVVKADPEPGPSVWQVLLLSFGPTILIVALFLVVMRRFIRSPGGIGGFGRSRAKRYDAQKRRRTTFDDIAGIEDAEEELLEVVDFLRDPDRYRRLGAAIPAGVLLSGPPGTGKTLLARAVAGEADVPFFSLSASEFVEMVVGVGASRVRDLFRQAKEAAPAIVFIDELDAVGRTRGTNAFGGHDEREQTLNQILTEMDGFSGAEGVIVLAATNRPEILDPALLRPGRFDRRIAVNPPDQAGRQRILWVHTRNVPLGDDVDLGQIASGTPGMVGADLKNLVNEAALTAARHRRDHVAADDFANALEKIILGTERRITISTPERERTAYHEAGHALLGMLVPGADPVRKVSIVPRGRALGVTFQSPLSDRYGFSAEYLRGRIAGALGGRAAEDLIYGDVTSGAESDLEQVTMIARQMVTRWGMSSAVGLLSLPSSEPDELILHHGTSEATRELIDSEIRRIIDECYEVALDLLGDNRTRLDALAQTLLERESLDAKEAYDAAGFADQLPDFGLQAFNGRPRAS